MLEADLLIYFQIKLHLITSYFYFLKFFLTHSSSRLRFTSISAFNISAFLFIRRDSSGSSCNFSRAYLSSNFPDSSKACSLCSLNSFISCSSFLRVCAGVSVQDVSPVFFLFSSNSRRYFWRAPVLTLDYDSGEIGDLG